MKVIQIGNKLNMLRLQNGEDISWFKVLESNNEHLDLVKSLNANDEVQIQYSTINGVKVINELVIGELTVEESEPVATKEKTEVDTILGSGNNFSNPVKPQEFKCEKCGASLKDGKYKTCYTCSMAARAASGAGFKSPEVQESIKRQAIGHMCSRTLIALQGTSFLSEGNLEDTMERIYRKYQQLVG